MISFFDFTNHIWKPIGSLVEAFPHLHANQTLHFSDQELAEMQYLAFYQQKNLVNWQKDGFWDLHSRCYELVSNAINPKKSKAIIGDVNIVDRSGIMFA